MTDDRSDDYVQPLPAQDAGISSASSQRLAKVLLVPLAALLTAIILIFYVFFGRGTVSGPSMMPTLLDHDYILITRGLPSPQRGDIVTVSVIFKGTSEEWVKRVVALAGDRVDVSGDTILVNGQPESFHHAMLTSGETMPILHITVPTGQMFIAGDNRGISEDSRYIGTVPVTAIRGKVIAIYAPIERIRLVPGP